MGRGLIRRSGGEAPAVEANRSLGASAAEGWGSGGKAHGGSLNFFYGSLTGS